MQSAAAVCHNPFCKSGFVRDAMYGKGRQFASDIGVSLWKGGVRLRILLPTQELEFYLFSRSSDYLFY